jgi:hypothetical protein
MENNGEKKGFKKFLNAVVVGIIATAVGGLIVHYVTKEPLSSKRIERTEKESKKPNEVQPTPKEYPKKYEKDKRLNDFRGLIDQHVLLSSAKDPNIGRVALVIESKNTGTGFSPGAALCTLFRNRKINVVENLFKEKLFIEMGFFEEIFGGNTGLLKETNALSGVDYLVLGKLNYSFEKGLSVDKDLVTCNVNFHYRVINKNGNVVRSDNINVPGADFSEDRALRRGLENLSDQHTNIIFKEVS